MRRAGKIIFSLVSILLGLSLLAAVFWPLASWYWRQRPLLGTDFFLTKTYVSYLERFFTFRPAGWKYIWSGGYPLALDYPTLHFYLIIPLTRFFSQVQAIQFYMLLATFLYGFFAFLLFRRLSQSWGFSLGLAVIALYSAGVYGSLLWGGGLPYFATQFFLPLVLWLIVRHFSAGNGRQDLVLAGFLTGLAFLAHAQAPAVSILPLGIIFVALWRDPQTPLISRGKITDLVIFSTLALISGFSFIRFNAVQIFNLIFEAVTFGQKVATTAASSGYSLDWELNQLWRVLTDVNPLFLPAIAAGIIWLTLGFLIGGTRPRGLWAIIPTGLSFLFVFVSLVLWAYRYNPLQGGWYRAFWTFPIIYGCLAAILWGGGNSALAGKKLVKVLVAAAGLLAGMTIIFLNLAQVDGFLETLGKSGNPSSAIPRVINLAVTREEENWLKKELVPDWVDVDDKNHRLFSIDVGHNIAWNSYFDLPLFHGYIDPPIPFVGRGYLYLADITFGKDELVERFKYRPEEAQNIARFIMDWSAVRYYEGGVTEGRFTAVPLSHYLEDLVLRDQIMNFEDVEVYVDFDLPKTWKRSVQTHFYEFKPNLVSPILEGNQAATLAVVGNFQAKDAVGRTLAAENTGSRKLVIINGPEKIDDWSLADFQKFDGIFLYAYSARRPDASWEIIRQYIERGGKVFIDTGGDVRETAGDNLPAVFPVRATKKGSLGKDWDFKAGGSPLTEAVNFADFDPPLIDGSEWGISYAENEKTEAGSRVILFNHGKVVMAEKSLGEGKVIWSGINLPYHLAYYFNNKSEREFFLKILENLIDLEEKSPVESKVEWVSPEKRRISLPAGTKGVLFREYLYSGWRAKIFAGRTETPIKIYPAGPAYPGYMYVPIPEALRGNQLVVEFSFHGRLVDWFWEILTLLTGLIVFDYAIFGGKLVVSRISRIWARGAEKASRWWDREEEY